MSMKNSSDTIGKRTRDIQACSAVPQPTTSLPAPLMLIGNINTRLTMSQMPQLNRKLRGKAVGQ
jgi:hypothetical protein